MVDDVMAVLAKWGNRPNALSKTRADVTGPEVPKNMQPDLLVGLTEDVMRVLGAFTLCAFPAVPPPDWPCPSACHGM